MFCWRDGDQRKFLKSAVSPALDRFRVSDDLVDKYCLFGLVYDPLYECFALGLCVVYNSFDELSHSRPIDSVQY